MRRALILLTVLAAFGIGSRALAADTPATSLSGPSGTTSSSTPTFRFTSNEAGSTFECRLGDGEWRACSSPLSLQLPDGDYVLSVRAIDAAGNVDPTPATRAFTVDTSLLDTAIAAGPAGQTNDPTPSFMFGSTTTGATFECMLEGPGSPLKAFARCSSPLTTPALASGAYALVVRAVAPDGARERTPARRAFTVDVDPPETEITGGPADGGESDSRTPAFRYRSEPGARFECRIDNKVKNGVDLVAWARCGAESFTAERLDGGRHTFEVRAVDAAGNPDGSPASRTFRVVACERAVHLGLVEATGDCLMDVGTDDAPRWESEGDVKVNGLLLPAPGAGKVVLEGPAPGDEDGGAIALDNLSLSIAGVNLYRGAVKWKLPKGEAGDEKELVAYDLSKAGEKLFGLKLTGIASLRLGHRKATGEYYAVLGLKVALPEVFKSGPGPGAGGVTGEVAIRIDEARGVQVDGLKIAVNNAYVGNLGVKSVCLSYLRAGATFVAACEPPRIGNGSPQPFLQCRSDNDADRWDGAAAMVLPTASGTELGLWAGLRAGRLSYAGGYADRLGALVPLAPGVFLDRVALGVCLEPPPLQIKGEAAIAFGPDFQGRKAILLDGSFHYTDAYNGQPWQIRAEGGLTLFDQRAAEAYVQYQSTGLLDFGFKARLAFGPASISGGVAGWVETVRNGRFNVNGYVDVCVDGLACAGASGVISSTGAAGCITVTLFGVPVPYFKGPMPWDWAVRYQAVNVTGGAGYTWATRHLDLMVGTCSIGAWEAQRATVSQAGSASIAVPAAQPATVIGVRGRGDAPKLLLVGPDGRRIASPVHDGGAFVPGSHLLVEDGDTTTVMIAKPAAGRWRVEAQPGSPPIAEVRRADARPEPQVGAHVGGRGHRRVLAYGYVPQPGQRVTFVERSRHTQQTLGVARSHTCRRLEDTRAKRMGLACGEIGFRPGLGGAGPRRILALVEQDGLPRTTLTVARYSAPPDSAPAVPRSVQIRRRGGAVRVSWRPGPGAVKQNIVVRVGDGRRLLFIRSARADAVRVPRVARRYGVSVTVRGMRLDGTEGRPAGARLRRGH